VKLARYYWLLSLLILPIGPSFAGGELVLQQVTDNVYAVVGELGNRSPENLGNNATFGFVVTADGVVLIDSGGTYRGAQQIEQLIGQVTDKPVVRVINTGGQDHRWLGNGYFKQRGADIVASEQAVADQRRRSRDQFILLSNLVGNAGVAGTDAVYADHSFADEFLFDLGATRFEIRHSGPAHTPGDSYVWLPQHKIMFSGDIVYVERMLGVGPQPNSKSWIEAFAAMAAYRPLHLVPGHGHSTTLAQATKDTLDYLVFLRSAVAEFMGRGGDISDIGSLDQSSFHYLLNHETLAGRNAQQVFAEMEWE